MTIKTLKDKFNSSKRFREEFSKPNTINLSKENMFGLVNYSNEPVLPKQSSIELYEESVGLIKPAKEAFRALHESLREKSSKLLLPYGSLFFPEKFSFSGYINPYRIYNEYLTNIYVKFTNIENLDDVTNFQEFVQKFKIFSLYHNEDPILLSSFLNSKYSSIQYTGLIIDLGINATKEDIYNDEYFDYFNNQCIKHGFLINQEFPNKIIYIPTMEDFDNHFITVNDKELSFFLQTLTSLYRTLINDKPYIIKNKQKIIRKVGLNIKPNELYNFYIEIYAKESKQKLLAQKFLKQFHGQDITKIKNATLKKLNIDFTDSSPIRRGRRKPKIIPPGKRIDISIIIAQLLNVLDNIITETDVVEIGTHINQTLNITNNIITETDVVEIGTEINQSLSIVDNIITETDVVELSLNNISQSFNVTNNIITETDVIEIGTEINQSLSVTDNISTKKIALLSQVSQTQEQTAILTEIGWDSQYSMVFDGATQYVNIDGAEGNYNHSVGWSMIAIARKDTEDVTAKTIVSYAHDPAVPAAGETWFQYYLNDNQISSYYISGTRHNTYRTNTNDYGNSEWWHLGMRFEPDNYVFTTRHYKNGVAQSRFGVDSSTSNLTSFLQQASIGSLGKNEGNGWIGHIQEVCIINRELDNAEMAEAYNSGVLFDLRSASFAADITDYYIASAHVYENGTYYLLNIGPNRVGPVRAECINFSEASFSNEVAYKIKLAPENITQSPTVPDETLTEIGWDNIYAIELDGATQFIDIDGAETVYSHTNGFAQFSIHKFTNTPVATECISSLSKATTEDRCYVYGNGSYKANIFCGADEGNFMRVDTVGFDTNLTQGIYNFIPASSSAGYNKVYVSGVLSSDIDQLAGTYNIESRLDKATLGAFRKNSSTGSYFDGRLYCWASFNRILTEAEAQEAYNSGTAFDLRESSFADAIVDYYVASAKIKKNGTWYLLNLGPNPQGPTHAECINFSDDTFIIDPVVAWDNTYSLEKVGNSSNPIQLGGMEQLYDYSGSHAIFLRYKTGDFGNYPNYLIFSGPNGMVEQLQPAPDGRINLNIKYSGSTFTQLSVSSFYAPTLDQWYSFTLNVTPASGSTDDNQLWYNTTLRDNTDSKAGVYDLTGLLTNAFGVNVSGTFSELATFDRKLTEAEIQELHNSGTTFDIRNASFISSTPEVLRDYYVASANITIDNEIHLVNLGNDRLGPNAARVPNTTTASLTTDIPS